MHTCVTSIAFRYLTGSSFWPIIACYGGLLLVKTSRSTCRNVGVIKLRGSGINDNHSLKSRDS